MGWKPSSWFSRVSVLPCRFSTIPAHFSDLLGGRAGLRDRTLSAREFNQSARIAPALDQAARTTSERVIRHLWTRGVFALRSPLVLLLPRHARPARQGSRSRSRRWWADRVRHSLISHHSSRSLALRTGSSSSVAFSHSGSSASKMQRVRLADLHRPNDDSHITRLQRRRCERSRNRSERRWRSSRRRLATTRLEISSRSTTKRSRRMSVFHPRSFLPVLTTWYADGSSQAAERCTGTTSQSVRTQYSWATTTDSPLRFQSSFAPDSLERHQLPSAQQSSSSTACAVHARSSYAL